MNKYILACVGGALLQFTAVQAQISNSQRWPADKQPKAVAALVTKGFLAAPHPNFSAQTKPRYITYPEVCTWYGALRFAKATQDKEMLGLLDDRFQHLLEAEADMIPPTNHVDYNVFGIVPLELYRRVKQPTYLTLGLKMADTQWQLPDTAIGTPAEQWQKAGYSWQTRMWIDDMYMMSVLQAQAFSTTGNKVYIERAAKEMCFYLDSLQQPNGLFYHAPDVPFYWGRGNGWVAAGMTEILRVLPVTNTYRARILKGYRKMMQSLLAYQDSSGLWRQLINEPGAWLETSGSGMFTYAMIMGVRYHWLEGAQYDKAAEKAWLGLTSYMNPDGKLREVCQGTNKRNDRQYYLDRKRITGDMHGQAPLLWCAAALLESISDAPARLSVASPFADNMVLQRNKKIKVWGWAGKQEKVTVQLGQHTATGRADAQGRWELWLAPLKAGGPFTMTVTGKEQLTIRNILVGEVWFCGGQSNMNFPFKSAFGADSAIRHANNNQIRLLTIPRAIGFNEKKETVRPAVWQECNEQTLPEFSAVAYYAGSKLQQELNVPIGLIHGSFGGSLIEDWVPERFTDTMAVYDEIRQLIRQHPDERAFMEGQHQHLSALFKGVTLYENEKPLWDTVHPVIPSFDARWRPTQVPGFWEDANGLECIDGVAWYRKTITLNAQEATTTPVMSLGKIADQCMVFVNGRTLACAASDRYATQQYTIPTGFLREGTNEIMVRVANKRKKGGFWSPAKDLFLSTGSNKKELAGQWHYWFEYGRAAIHPNDLGASLYNGMVTPFAGFSMQGVIWYQGESNASIGLQYHPLLVALVTSWRKAWSDTGLHFSVIQIPNYKKRVVDPNSEVAWTLIREAQQQVLALPRTSLPVTFDLGDADDTHPREKRRVGERVARQLLAKVYHRPLVADGPVFERYRVKGDTIELYFKESPAGLLFAGEGEVDKAFAIAGADKKFYWANAIIKGNKVLVANAQVKQPVAIRYGWADNPNVVLYNREQLPAAPFRTDHWMIPARNTTKQD